jgi:hypothetical protein
VQGAAVARLVRPDSARAATSGPLATMATGEVSGEGGTAPVDDRGLGQRARMGLDGIHPVTHAQQLHVRASERAASNRM